jgi:photosystem II stability/assembly factor-like uncharacterized protein
MDKGETWDALDSGTSVTLMAGALLDDGSVMLAGQGGTLLIRGPGAQSFSPANNPDRRPVIGLIQTDKGNVLLVGLGGIRKADSTGAPLASTHEDQ